MRSLSLIFLLSSVALAIYAYTLSLLVLFDLAIPNRERALFPVLLLMAAINSLIGRSYGSLLLTVPFQRIFSFSSFIKIASIVKNFLFVYAVLLFIGGIIPYYDAPIRPAGNGVYLGKGDKRQFSREQYEQFVRWESALFLAWPAMFVLYSATTKPTSATKRKPKLRKK